MTKYYQLYREAFFADEHCVAAYDTHAYSNKISVFVCDANDGAQARKMFDADMEGVRVQWLRFANHTEAQSLRAFDAKTVFCYDTTFAIPYDVAMKKWRDVTGTDLRYETLRDRVFETCQGFGPLAWKLENAPDWVKDGVNAALAAASDKKLAALMHEQHLQQAEAADDERFEREQQEATIAKLREKVQQLHNELGHAQQDKARLLSERDAAKRRAEELAQTLDELYLNTGPKIGKVRKQVERIRKAIEKIDAIEF